MQSVRDFMIKHVHIVTLVCVALVLVYCAIMCSVPNMKVRVILYKIFVYTIAGIIGLMILILLMWIVLQRGF